MGRKTASKGSRIRGAWAPAVGSGLLGLWLVAISGCERPQAQFSTNRIYLRYQEEQTRDSVRTASRRRTS